MNRKTIALLSFLLVAACAPQDSLVNNNLVKEAQVADITRAGTILQTLPAPQNPLPVVVYDFQDLTGQLKSNDNFAEYSSAVTKGGAAVLVKALLDAGAGSWFLVAERNSLNNLLQERQIIRSMREEYERMNGPTFAPLPPMVYGGMMLEGGIIFYDSNVYTGGAAAGYFGISSSVQYRRDVVSVYLRGVDISNGQVVLSVNTSKTVFSYAVNTGLIRYLAYDKLLEAEAGFTVNEPSQFAVRQAIETAVYSLIMEGNLRNMWQFADEEAGGKALAAYMERKNAAVGAENNISTVPNDAKEVKPENSSGNQGEKGIFSKLVKLF